MPRGGKRPGAGAPRGNFNGVRTGDHSVRMLAVYLALVNYPEEGLKALGDDLYKQGFYPPPEKRFNGDLRGFVAYLYRRWFDSPAEIQSNAIKPNQTQSNRHPQRDRIARSVDSAQAETGPNQARQSGK